MQLPRLKLTAYKQLAGLLSLLYAITLVILLFSNGHGWLKLLLLLAVSIYVWYAITRFALRTSSSAIMQCWLDEKGLWNLQTKTGRLYRGILRGDSLITPYLTILSFKINKRYWPLAITITPDAIDKEAFRRLRVYLRTTYAKTARIDAY